MEVDMIFIENAWEEFICLDHVAKIWMGNTEQYTKIHVKLVDGSEDELSIFRDREKARKYIENLLSGYGEIKVITGEDLK
jgi:hypothetical protein